MPIAARVQGLARVNEVCVTEAVMDAPGVSDIVKGRSASRGDENLKGIDQKMEIHRIDILRSDAELTAAKSAIGLVPKT